MFIEKASPSSHRSRKKTLTNRSYAELFEIIEQSPGEWFKVDPKGVAGKSPKAKQNSIGCAARGRGKRTQTTYENEFLYVRLINLQQ